MATEMLQNDGDDDDDVIESPLEVRIFF